MMAKACIGPAHSITQLIGLQTNVTYQNHQQSIQHLFETENITYKSIKPLFYNKINKSKYLLLHRQEPQPKRTISLSNDASLAFAAVQSPTLASQRSTS